MGKQKSADDLIKEQYSKDQNKIINTQSADEYIKSLASQTGTLPSAKSNLGGLENTTYGTSPEYQKYYEQSGWDMTANALVNTAAEIGFGLGEGVGYLADIPQMIELAKGNEQEFGNWFSDLMINAKENTKEAMPIYQGIAPAKFDPTSATWWAEHAPSIGSAVSLLIPSSLAVKGLGAAAKLLGGNKLLTRGAQLLSKSNKLNDIAKVRNNLVTGSKGISAALISRYMENTMESKGVFDENYELYLKETGDKELAKVRAGEAASNAWYANNANLLFDLPQYLSIYKSAGILGKTLASKAKTVGKSSIQEGFEEMFQYGIGKEATAQSKEKYGLGNGSNFSDRFEKYIRDGEMWTAFTMGALGGGVFQLAGETINKYSNYRANNKKAQEAITNQVIDPKRLQEHAIVNNNNELFDNIQDSYIVDLALSKLERGATEEELITEIEQVLDMNEEELLEYGIKKEDTGKITEKLVRIYNRVKTARDSSLKNQKTPELQRFETVNRIENYFIKDKLVNIKENSTKLLKTIQTENNISQEEVELIRLKELRKTASNNKDDVMMGDIDEQIKVLTQLIQETTNPKFQINDLNKIATEEYAKSLNTEIELENILDKNLQTFKHLQTTEGKKAIQNSIKKAQDDIIEEQVSEIVKDVNKDISPIDVENKINEGKAIGKEKEITQEINDKLHDVQLQAFPISEENFLSDIHRRYKETPAIESKELNELEDILGVMIGEDVDVLNTVFSSDEEARIKIMSFYNSLKPKISENEIIEYNGELEGQVSLELERGKEPKRQAFLSQGQEFEYVLNEKGEYQLVKDEKGNFIPSSRNDFNQDHFWLNDSTSLPKGSQINYEIDTTDEYNKSKNVNTNNRKILMVHYIDGNILNKQPSNRKIVGMLAAYNSKREYTSSKEVQKLKKLREAIDKEFENNTNDVFESKITTKVKEKFSGRFYNTNEINSPQQILKEDDELILGVGVEINGQPTLQIPNFPYEETVRAKNILPGAVYQILPASNGKLVPYRLRTTSLENLPDVKEEIKVLFNFLKDNPKTFKETVSKIKDLVYIQNINLKNNEIEITDKGETFILKDYDAYLNTKIAQVDVKKINKGDYNINLSDREVLKTDIKPLRYTVDTKVAVEPYDGITEIKVPEVDKKIESKQQSKKVTLDNTKENNTFNKKLVDILSSNKAKQIFEKSEKNNWDLNKILAELQVSKEQKQIILDKKYSLSMDSTDISKYQNEVELNREYQKLIRTLNSSISEYYHNQQISNLSLKQELNNSNNLKRSEEAVDNALLELDKNFGIKIKSIKEIINSNYEEYINLNAFDKVTFINNLLKLLTKKELLPTIDILKGRYDLKHNKIISSRLREEIIKSLLAEKSVDKIGEKIKTSNEITTNPDSFFIGQTLHIADTNYGEIVDILESEKSDDALITFDNGNTIRRSELIGQLINNNENVEPKVEAAPKKLTGLKGLGKINIDLNFDERNRLEPSKPYTKLNIEEEIQWFKERFPNVPIEVLSNIKEVSKNGKRSWGTFRDNMVYLWDKAGTGTTYHEAFHVAFHLSLNDVQREEILDEAAILYKIENSPENKIKLEEELAEDFRRYIEQKGNNNLSLPRRIANFFNNLYQMIKEIFNKNISIDSLFYKIDNKFYKNTTVPINPSPTRYRPENIDPITWRSRYKMINYHVLKVIDKIRESVPEFEGKEDIKIIKGFGLPSLYGHVAASFQDIIETTRNEYVKEELQIVLDNLFTEIKDGKPSKFGNLYYDAIRDLSTYGLNINLRKNTISDNPVEKEGESQLYEISEEQTQQEGWQIVYQETNGKDNIRQQVKKKLATIQSTEIDDIGFNKFIEFDYIYNYLENNLSNILTKEEMIDKLEELTKFKKELNPVLEELKSNEIFSTQFFTDLTNAQTSFSFVKKDSRRRLLDPSNPDTQVTETFYRIFNSNRANIKSVIIDNWKANLINSANSSIVDNNKLISTELAKPKIGKIKTLLNEFEQDQSNAQEISDTLTDIGLDISTKAITDQFQESVVYNKGKKILLEPIESFRRFSSTLSIILNSLENGNNPFIEEFSENSSINKLVKLIAKSEFDLLQSSFRNVEGKTVYGHLLHNYLSKFTNRIKNSNELKRLRKNDFFKYNTWLRLLDEDLENLNNFEYTILDGFKVGNSAGKKYTDLSDMELEVINMNMYYNGGNKYGNFRVPILADSPAAVYIKFKKQSLDEVVDGLYQIALQEQERNTQIRKDKKTNKPLIKNYHSTDTFKYLPFLESVNINKEKDVKDAIVNYLEQQLENDKIELKKIDVINNRGTLEGSIDNTVLENQDFHREYFYNSVFANIQISQITSGDIAFYKDTKDFFKRNSQIWKPGKILDTSVIRDHYRAIYLKDIEKPSKYINIIKKSLEANGNFTNKQISEIINKYKYINQTDGQSFITLDRYKEIMRGLGRWTKLMEDNFQAVKDGKATPKQLKIMMSPIKPFYFGTIEVDGRIIPVQHKNSEVPLIPQLISQSKELSSLYEYMTDPANNIDVIHFESVVKVGEFGTSTLENIINNKDLPITHTLNNSDYAIQQEVPEHFIDTKNLLGSQIRKLIFSDLDSNAKYFKDMSSKELLELNQEILTENIKDSYNELVEKFGESAENIDEIQKILLEEIEDRGLGEEYSEMLKIVKDSTGNRRFKLPLFFPAHAKRIESLLNSIFKNKITKQKINGASYTLTSNVGFDDKLSIVFGEDGSIQYYEAMLPWWSKKYFPTNPNGTVNFELIKEQAPELLDMIGYRIPTEDKYSMKKIRVIGFTPQEAGGQILLPAEITTISGEDFDIDKLYLMIRNFDVIKEDGYNKIKIIKTTEEELKDISKLSKKQRDNLLIDIYESILAHPSTSPAILNPGGFEDLIKLSETINKLRKIDENENIALPHTQRVTYRRNMTGASLIGVYANHNSNHAVIQHTKVNFVKPLQILSFKSKELYNTIDRKGNKISRNLATLLAAVVDNAKTPVADALNINNYTANFLATLLRLGLDMDNAINILNQPIIRDLSYQYSINPFNLQNVIIKRRSELKDKVGTFKGKTLLSKLRDNIKADKTPDIEFYNDQLNILKLWTILDSQYVEPLNKLIKVSKADTIGVTKSLANNEEFENTIKELKLSNKFTGISELLDINNSPYKSLAAFTEYGIIKPNKILSNLFPYKNKAFTVIKRNLADIKGSPLTVKELDKINSHIQSFMISNFKLFDIKEKIPTIVGSNSVPEKLANFKLNYNEFEIIKHLNIKEQNDIKIIYFTNNGSMTPHARQAIIDSWNYLINSDNEYFRNMGIDLIKYAYHTSGFTYTSNGYSQLIPTDFYANLRIDNTSLSEHLYKAAKESENEIFHSFLDQYVRNNYKVDNIIPKIDTSTKLSRYEKSLISTLKGGRRVITSFLINPKTAKNFKRDDHVSLYIKNTIGTTDYLYRHEGYKGDYAIYNLIPALGYENLIREYAIYNDELQTRVSSNNYIFEETPQYHEPNNEQDVLYNVESRNERELEESFGLRQPDGSRTRYISYDKVINKIRNINKQAVNKWYYAKRIQILGEKGDRRVYNAVQILPKENYQVENTIKNNPDKELNERLKTLLNSLNFKVEYYDEIKTILGTDAKGMVDFMKKIVKVSKHNEDINTLPEETSHVVVRLLKDTPLYARMEDIIDQHPVYNEVLNDYSKEYNNNTERLKEEAIGKLLGTYLIKKNKKLNIPERFARVLQKLWDQFKSIFSNLDIAKIQNEYDQIFGKLAEDILNNNLTLDKELEETSSLYQVNKNINKLKSIFENSIDTIYKKLKLYEYKGNESYVKRERELLNTLLEEYDNENDLLGLITFVDNVKNEAVKIHKRFDKLKTDELSVKEKIKTLKHIHDYTVSYIPILEDLNTELRDLKDIEDTQKTELINIVGTLLGDLKAIDSNYLIMARKYLAQVLQKYNSNPNINIEKSLEIIDKDISYSQRWLDSIAESNDDIIKIVDIMFKEYRQLARLETLKISKKLENIKISAEKDGIPSFKHFYERDKKGNLTGNILKKHNYTEWNNTKELFFDTLRAKYGIKGRGDKPPVGTNERIAWDREIAEWFQANTQTHPDAPQLIEKTKKQLIKEFGEKEGIVKFNSWLAENSGINYQGEEYYKRELGIPNDKYLNQTYKELTEKEQKYLNELVGIYEELQNLLPQRYRTKNLAPQTRKDMVERMLSSNSKWKEFKESVSEMFIKNEDETEFGSPFVLTDENNEPVNMLPVFYTNKLDDMSNLSTDLTSSLLLFANMAYNYNYMNRIVDTIELSKDVLKERSIKTGKVDPVTVLKDLLTGEKRKKEVTKKSKENSLVYDRYVTYIDMNLYGKQKREEGNINLFGKKLDKAKTIDTFNKYVSIKGLALNLYAGIANPLLGNVMTRIEAIAKEYFTNDQLLKADKIYATELPKTLNEIGKRKQTNKLQLYAELMDTFQDWEHNINDKNFERKVGISRAFKESSLFFISSSGEHQIQLRSSLALAVGIQLKDKNNKIYNLWEAMNVIDNKLILKPDLTIIADGKTFRKSDEGQIFDNQKLITVINKQNFINERLHGIYNNVDKSAVQQLALGRLALTFRKFIKPGWNRRFEEKKFNQMGRITTEGYYNTTYQFLNNLLSDLKKKQYDFNSSWKNLNETEKANVVRSLTEVSYMFAFMVIGAVLTGMAEDNDDDNWILNMAAYQANRLYTEIGFFVPGPTMFTEGYKILRSPAAGVSVIQDFINFAKVTDWTSDFESGKNKDRNKFLIRGLKLVPLGSNIQKMTSPEEQLDFFLK